MPSQYEAMKQTAAKRLADVDQRRAKLDEERTALVKLIEGIDKLIALDTENGGRAPQPSVATATSSPESGGRVTDESDPLAAQQESLIKMAVNILAEEQKPLRTSDLLNMIQQKTGRTYNFSSLAKALQREAAASDGAVTQEKLRGPWQLRER
jgi:hypothetical protein